MAKANKVIHGIAVNIKALDATKLPQRVILKEYFNPTIFAEAGLKELILKTHLAYNGTQVAIEFEFYDSKVIVGKRTHKHDRLITEGVDFANQIIAQRSS